MIAPYCIDSKRRRQLMASQLNGLLEMVPIGTVGAVLSVLLLTNMMQGTSVVQVALIVSAFIFVYQFMALRAYLVARQQETRREASVKIIKRLVLRAGVHGVLWGGMCYLVISSADSTDLFVSGMILGGTLLITSFCYRSVPQASLTFIAVSGIFLALGLFSRPEVISLVHVIGLIVAYYTLVPAMVLQQSKEFFTRCINELNSNEEAEISNALLNRFEETGHDWFWATDENGYLERASDNLRSFLSTVNSAFSDTATSIKLGDFDPDSCGSLSSVLAARQDFEDLGLRIDLEDGKHWVSFSGRTITRNDGSFGGFAGVCADVTKARLAEEKIVEMAIVDGLTGLHNRTSLYKEIDVMVRRLERYATPFTLLFLDLDKFKLVNDSYGHHVGDALLKEASNRIRSVLRDKDVVGRLGGDEFAVLVQETNDPVFVAKLAARIIQIVSEPYEVENETLYIGLSVGIAMAPIHGTQREQLLRNADLALYRAKDDGRGVFRYFEAQMDFEQRERRMLEQEMRQALSDNEFEMKFQPMISTQSGRVACMEALIRWNHSIRGRLSPDEFISIAEQSNLIVDVGRWSIKSACNTALTWPEDVKVAVNISGMHFMRSDIVGDVRQVLEETGITPSRLEVEITESILIDNNGETVTKLNGLRALGVSIAMDDFGTGYSSLGYLTRFKFDRLKIDKSFLMGMEENENRKAIVYAISALGENLNIDITVEGVETREHVEFLKTIHCDQAQGYYYSKPIPVSEVPAFLLRTFSEAISTRSPATIKGNTAA